MADKVIKKLQVERVITKHENKDGVALKQPYGLIVGKELAEVAVFIRVPFAEIPNLKGVEGSEIEFECNATIYNGRMQYDLVPGTV